MNKTSSSFNTIKFIETHCLYRAVGATDVDQPGAVCEGNDIFSQCLWPELLLVFIKRGTSKPAASTSYN